MYHPRMIRVVFAEDNYLVREGTAALLATSDQVELVGTATTRDELLAAVEEHAPDAVLTDIRMPPTGTNEGIEAAKTIRASHPEIGVVVLSQFVEEDYAYDLLKDGAAGLGYLLKERVADVDELVRALGEVAARRQRPGSRRSSRRSSPAKDRMAHSPLAQLTDREREVLSHMAQGENNAAIAASLFLTERAVEKHINSLFHKLGLTEEPDVHRRVMAVLAFLRETERRLTSPVVPHCARRVSTMNTEHGAWRSTMFGTLSRTRHRVPCAPRFPTTIVSAQLLLGHVADPVGRLAALDPRAGRHVGEPRRDPREVRVRVGGAVRIDDGAEIRFRLHVQDQELRSPVAGQSSGVLHGEVCRRGGVGSYQDGAHLVPPSVLEPNVRPRPLGDDPAATTVRRGCHHHA